MMTDDILDGAELAIDDGSAREDLDRLEAAVSKTIAEDQYFWAIEMGFNNTEACAIADAAVIDYNSSFILARAN